MGMRLEGVTHSYPLGPSAGSHALEGVGFTLERGELVLVMGPAGSGKSTLLRIAAGLIRPTAGTVRVDGVDPGAKEASPGVVGMVFQSPERQLFADSVLDDVAFGPGNLGRGAEALADARRALEAVGLVAQDVERRSPFSLSGGEARRVAIAGVLAMSCPYILMDEPTAGLDAAGRAAVRSAITGARSEAGVAVVTHDPEELLDIADGVLLLKEGRVVHQGAVSDTLTTPSIFARADLEPPGLIQLQSLAAERPGHAFEPTLDPGAVASALLATVGRMP